MRRIKKFFEEIFGIPLPQQMLFDGNLNPIWDPLIPQPDPKEAPLQASDVAIKVPPPVVMSTMESFFSASEGYYFIGFYERGINNFDFFYARMDSWRRVYFRLSYGGAYTNGDKERKSVREFLPRYFEFERKLAGNVKLLKVIEGVGNSEYTIVLPDGQTFEKRFFTDSVLYNPNFEEKFRDVLKAL